MNYNLVEFKGAYGTSPKFLNQSVLKFLLWVAQT